MIQIRAHAEPRDFLERAQEMLEQQEAANNLILGLADVLMKYPERFPQFYLVTGEDDSGVQVAGLMTPPNNLIVYGQTRESEAMVTLSRYFADRQIALPGVVGLVDSAHAFATAWTKTVGGSWSVRMHERVYELRQVVAPHGVAGSLVVAGQEHQSIIVDWLAAFHAEALPGSPQRANFEEMANHCIADKNLSFWVVAGEPVSMAVGPSRVTRHGGTVGPVYTPPQKRGHGYASAVVAGVSQKILDAGKTFCTLFTDLSNPTSNSIYQKIGYRPFGDFDEIVFEK